MFGGEGVAFRCDYFWWDSGPKDESGDNPGEYVDLWCQKDGKKLTMGILEHTARRGCCSWKKPKPEEMFPSDEDKTGKKFGIWRN